MAAPPALKLLFLGDDGHHRPRERFAQLQPILARRGIELVYTDRVSDLAPDTLRAYAGVVLYANIDAIEPAPAKALLDFVAGGGGFVPLHCASYCFRNNDEIVALMGAQFQRHGTGVFRVAPTPEAARLPLLHGYRGFESWDETYVHTKHNERDRTVLEYREDAEGREPWTWIRTHGKGRVFYTAWGHDGRTWGNPGFQNLVERGIRWACGDDPGRAGPFADRPELSAKRTDVAPFDYVEAKIPFYPAGEKWGTTGEPISKMQKPLSAEESAKHFVHPVGFDVQIYADEPSFGGKPIAMNWDERGRLWVCVTVDYPNALARNNRGRDRVVVCEDTDGDGRADKFTSFAENLSIPAAIVRYRNGVVVQNGTETLYLEDTNGDGQADLRKTLVTGWAMNDTHGGVSNFRLGLDNWVYAMQGYNRSWPKFGRGLTAGPFAQGFFRFRLEGEGKETEVAEIEFLRSTNNNTWGLGISEEGLIFGSTANANPSEFMPIANRYYEAVRGLSPGVLGGIAGNPKFTAVTENVRQVDNHGGFTAGCGHALYTARAYPREYWNRTAFVCEPTGHIAATFVLEPVGADFRSHIGWNLVASDDQWTAPIMAEVGPDGNVWVLDWYNYIVQHNPTPAGYQTGRGNAYEIELRDKKHGRVYRLAPAEAARPEVTSLAPADPPALVAALRNDNMLWRLHAQRLLVERGDRSVVPALVELVGDPSVDEIGLAGGATHALWTLHGLGALDGSNRQALAAAEKALTHPAAGVRRTAVQVLPRRVESVGAIVAAKLLADPEPQVRLAALLALADMPPTPAAAQAVVAALADPVNAQDRWLLDAATSAAARHDAAFLAAVAGDRSPALAPQPLEVVTGVAEHLARGGQADAVPSLLAALADARPETAAAIVAGLASGWPKDQRESLPAAAEAALPPLLQKLPAGARGQLLSLAKRWGATSLEKFADEIAAGFRAVMADEAQSDAARADAAAQLVGFRLRDAGAAGEVLALITARTSPELAERLLAAVGKSEAAGVGTQIVERLASLPPTTRRGAIRLLLGRSEWTTSLLDALQVGQLDLADLALDQKQALASHPNRDLAARAKEILAKGGSLPNPDRQKVIDEVGPQVLHAADASRGKEVFKQQCAKCHMHSGEGKKIGPDLTGMAAHPKSELIVQILDPSRSVEGNYRQYSVVLQDGQVVSGLLASDSRTAIVVVDAEAKEHAIQRSDIEELIASNKSLMPEGFEKQVPLESLADLLEFLTARGKYLPLPLSKAATVATTRDMFFDNEGDIERLVFDDWSPKTVAGVPFVLIDPQGGRLPNAIMLHGPQGVRPPQMPKSVTLPCNAPAKAVHMLSGISGWGYPLGRKGSVSLIVRLHYADGQTEDHDLLNGVHFADYIRRVDVPESKFAFGLRGQQLRYLSVEPKRAEPIHEIELVKGPDDTAPIVMAVTVESP